MCQIIAEVHTSAMSCAFIKTCNCPSPRRGSSFDRFQVYLECCSFLYDLLRVGDLAAARALCLFLSYHVQPRTSYMPEAVHTSYAAIPSIPVADKTFHARTAARSRVHRSSASSSSSAMARAARLHC